MNDLSAITKEIGDLSRWTKCPNFWLAKPDMGMPFIRGLKQATTRVIGKSVGGLEIIAIEYGEKEPIETTSDCLQSSLASSVVPPDPTNIFPQSFYGKNRRKK